jgi:hypothetical protein
MKKFIFFSLIFLFLFESCTKELDSSTIQYKNKLVVNLLAYDNDVLAVHVGQSLSLYDSTAEKLLETAKVKVTDESGVVSLLKFDLIRQKFVSTWIPKTDVKYTLQVDYGNLNSTLSDFTIPKLTLINKAKWTDKTSKDSVGFPTGTIDFTIKDNGTERNYYEIGLFRFDDVISDWLPLQIIAENPEFVDNQVKNKQGALIIQDGSFNGQSKLLKFTTPYGTAGSTYKYLVVIKNLSEQYYRYFKSIDNYKQQQGIFSEPSPVFTNIRGGVGICAGASIVKDTIQ